MGYFYKYDYDEKPRAVTIDGGEELVVPFKPNAVTLPEQKEETPKTEIGGSEVVIPSPTVQPSDTGNSGNASGSGAGSNEVETNTDTAVSDKTVDNYLDTEIYNVLQQIFNREKFSYDMNGDALYQQYADIYQNNANLAMQNAMAQSAAMTGGYGNSYAQAAGQQAYAQQMQNLNAVGMDLYDRAYSQYQAEGQDLYNQFATLYGISQDKEASDQWHATYGNFEYDEKTGNIIGLTGGEAEEQRIAAEEAANPNTTYAGTSDFVGANAEVPKQLANVNGLTTTNTAFFDDSGRFLEAATVDVKYVRENKGNSSEQQSDPEDVFTYNLGGKEIKLRRGVSPYTNTTNPDAKNGTFNGFQPNNVGGAPLYETDDTYIVNGRPVPIYKTQSGTEYVYDAANNEYRELKPANEESK